MRKPVRLALAVFALIASFMVVQYTGVVFAYSWLDILLALINWSTFGYRLIPLTIAGALVYSVVVGLAVAVLVVSALDIVHAIEAITMKKSMKS